MKILYVHGYGAHWDPDHPKIEALKSLGQVIGVDIQYNKGHDHAFNRVHDEIVTESPDLLIGTGIGGHTVAAVGAKKGVPFVAMNPIITPSECMLPWVGGMTDGQGGDLYLPESVVTAWPDIVKEGQGLVLVETADEITGAYITREELGEVFDIHVFNGGCHAFRHVEQAVPIIKEWLDKEREDL